MIRVATFALCVLMPVIALACSADETPHASEIGEKRIALTYDDAPTGDGEIYTGTERTAAFLAQLAAVNSGPVALFVTTKGMNKPEGRARIAAYADAGHVIANHSDRHLWASRTEAADYIADIDVAEEKLKGIKNRRAWYRFPFLDEGGLGKDNKDGVKRDELRAALQQRNIINGYVTVDTYDWHLDRLWREALRDGKDVNEQAVSKIYVDMVLDAADHYDDLSVQVLGRRPAQILLLHENDLAGHFTSDLVQALRADGWTIIHPDEAYADPIANRIPVTLFSGMGRVSALAADSGLRGKEVFDHWSASEAGIEQKIAESGAFSTAE